MPARRSLSAVPGAVHVNRASSTPVRRAPVRPPRAAPLALRLAPRAIAATHAQPARKRHCGGPCRRLPAGLVSSVVEHEDAISALRRWARRRFD